MKRLNKKKIIVTGAKGRFGKALILKLKQEGAIVDAVDLPKFDLGEKILITKYADIVYHLASLIPKSGKDLTKAEARKCVRMTFNIARTNKSARIIYASGWNVYGKLKGKAFKETQKRDPVTNYGQSKYLSEDIIKIYSGLNKFSYINFRISNIWGPQFRRKGDLIDTLWNKISHNQDIELSERGEEKRNRIWIDDLVEAFILGGLSKYSGNINLGYKTSYSSLETAKALKGLLKNKSRIILKERTELGTSNNSIDISKAKRVLKWRPKIGLKKGLALIIK